MADISKIAKYINGAIETLDLSTNTLVMQSLKLGSTELTEVTLGKLITVAGVADADGSYDSRYYTETELSDTTASSEGTALIGHTGETLKAKLDGLDSEQSTQNTDISNLETALGNANAADMGSYTGSTLTADQSAKTNIQELETSLETKAADADVVKKSGSTMDSAANITFVGGGEVLGLPATPSEATAAASKSYVDAMATGLRPKGNVRAASTSNMTISSAPAAVDGITLVVGDRVLIKDQTDPKENGIYDFNGAGSAFTRSEDQDNSPQAEILNGVMIPQVLEGTINGGQPFFISSVGSGTDGVHTIGVDDIDFDLFTSPTQLSAGNGIDISAGIIAVSLAADPGLEFDGSALRVKVKASGGIVRDADGLSITLANNTTDDLTEGSTNKYYSSTLFDSDFSGKDSADLNHTQADPTDWTVGDGSDIASHLDELADRMTAAENDNPSIQTKVAEEAFAADMTYFVRYTVMGESADRVAKATSSRTGGEHYWAIGIAQPTGAISAADPIDVTMQPSEITLGSGDTPFNAADQGKPLYLDAAGGFTTTPPDLENVADLASVIVGQVITTNKFKFHGMPNLVARS